MDQLSSEVLRSKLVQISRLKLGGAALVFGEAGIGKSHFLQGLRHTLRCLHLTLHATEPPERLLEQLPFRSHCAMTVSAALGHLRQQQRPNRTALLDLLLTQLKAAAPVIVFVEDLHEADAEQLVFWQRLQSSIQRLRGVGLVMASRSQPLEGIAVYRIAPLTLEQTQFLLQTASVGGVLPDMVAQAIWERCQGNPLFSLEYFKFLQREGLVWFDGETWHTSGLATAQGLPLEIEHLILDHLRVEDPLASPILAVYACLGRDEIELDIIAQVLRRPRASLEATLEELNRSGLLQGRRLIHPLFREVALKHLSRDLRRRTVRALIGLYTDDPLSVFHLLDDPALSKRQSSVLLERCLERAEAEGRHDLRGLLLTKYLRFVRGAARAKCAYQAARLLEDNDPALALELLERATLLEPSQLTYVIGWFDLLARRRGVDALRASFHRYQGKLRRALGVQWPQAKLVYCYIVQDHAQAIQLWERECQQSDGMDIKIWEYAKYAYTQSGEFAKMQALHTEMTRRFTENRLEHLGFFVNAYNRLDPSDQDGAVQLQTRIQATLERCQSEKRYVQQRLLLFIDLIWLQREVIEQPERRSDQVLALRDLVARCISANATDIVYISLFPYMEVLLDTGDLAELDRTYQRYARTAPPPFDMLLMGYYCRCILQATELRVYAKPFFLHALRSHIDNQSQMAANNHLMIEALILLELYIGTPEHAHPHLTALESHFANEPRDLYRITFYRSLYYQATQQSALAQAAFQRAETLWQHGTDGNPYEELRHSCHRVVATRDLAGAEALLPQLEQGGQYGNRNMLLRHFPELQSQTPPSLTASARTGTAAHCVVYTFGSFRIVQHQTQLRFHSRTGKRLIALLLEARILGQAMTKLELCTQLFPTVPERLALKSLYVLVHRLRANLGKDVILTDGEHYALGAVSSDLEQFYLEGEIGVCQGLYLEDVDILSQLREELVDRLAAQVRRVLDHDPAEAMRLGKLLVEMEPYDKGLLVLALQAQRANHIFAQRIGKWYAQAKRRFLEVGEHLPQHWDDLLELEPAPAL
jgi:hypothetical protein